MQQFRRLVARQLVRLARWIHFDEAAPPAPIIQQAAPTLEIPLDYEWQEQRISQLHRANRALMDANQKFEMSYRLCRSFVDELRTTRKQRETLDDRLWGLFSWPG